MSGINQTTVSPNTSGVHSNPADDSHVGQPLPASFLANVLSNPQTGYLASDGSYRRYASTVQTTATLAGNTDSSTRRIIYEVGRHFPNPTSALSLLPDEVLRMDCSYPTGAVLCDDFEGLARKFSNFSGSFNRSNFAGVVERLAKTLAACSLYPSTSTDHMRSGILPNVVALNTLGTPVSASESAVFIPRLADSILTPDVFSALVHAVTGEGGTVVTDVVTLDTRTNQAIVHHVEGPALARACVDALRLLGANFSASGAGDVYSYALTRGIHSVLTVVGHTDEGGVMRSLLRKSGFSTPYGGIHYNIGVYVGLPALSSTSPANIAGYVDALALKTAAVVAHCDPGITFEGQWFPTVLSAGSSEAPPPPGADEAVAPKAKGKAAAAFSEAVLGAPLVRSTIVKAHKSALAQAFGPFASNYIRALMKLFNANSDSGNAARHFIECPHLLSEDERHLAYASVAPFYWIEPTTLIAHDFTGLPAETEGFAAYSTVGSPRTLPAFEQCHAYGAGSSTNSYYVVKMRSPRASPFMAHWNGHSSNGLGCISIRQLDPNGIIHPGHNEQYNTVQSRIEAALPLSAYLWKRGQSPYSAPAEFLNIKGTMGIRVNHITWSDDGDLTMNHVPQHHEFLSTAITFHASAPGGLKEGPTNQGTTECRRARTRATRALASALLRSQVFGTPDVLEMPILTSAPSLPSAPPPPQFRSDHEHGSLGASAARSNTGDSGVRASTQRSAPTEPLEVVLQHSAQRAPTTQRGPGAVYGSGQPPAAGQSTGDPLTATPQPVSTPAAGVTTFDPSVTSGEGGN